MEATHRPAVRIVCLDVVGQLLLLHWRDPFDGSLLWEPPGGGIEPGETPLQAARRELGEETGLEPEAVLDRSVVVERRFHWNGVLFAGEEQFFLARFGTEQPALSGAGLQADERVTLTGHRWLYPAELAGLTDRLEPPDLEAVVEELARGTSLPRIQSGS